MTACANLGVALEHGQGVAKDVARAGSLYALACSFGLAGACIHARMLEEYERGTPRDLAKARDLWAMRCEKQNDGKACSYQGMLAEDGLGGEPEDEQRAGALMRRACRLSEPESCRWLRDHARAVGTN
jgi:TPR repeat protein